MNFVTGSPSNPPEKDTDRKPGGDGKLAHEGQIYAKDATRPKTTAEKFHEAGKVDELALELARQRDAKQARVDALAALDHDARVAREQAATEREVAEQARKQKLQTEQENLENRRHQLAAWQRLKKVRAEDGFEDFK